MMVFIACGLVSSDATVGLCVSECWVKRRRADWKLWMTQDLAAQLFLGKISTWEKSCVWNLLFLLFICFSLNISEAIITCLKVSRCSLKATSEAEDASGSTVEHANTSGVGGGTGVGGGDAGGDGGWAGDWGGGHLSEWYPVFRLWTCSELRRVVVDRSVSDTSE